MQEAIWASGIDLASKGGGGVRRRKKAAHGDRGWYGSVFSGGGTCSLTLATA